MSDLDKNVKRIHSDNIRRTCKIRAGLAAKDKPTEKAAEIFRRKAYEKMGNQNTCKNTGCVFYEEKPDCEAKETCAGYQEKQLSWKDAIMRHFMKGE